jgi:hypothetical protein
MIVSSNAVVSANASSTLEVRRRERIVAIPLRRGSHGFAPANRRARRQSIGAPRDAGRGSGQAPVMRFEHLEEVPANIRAVAVDGLVPGAALSLSHWEGNATPAALKADSSTEIVLRAADTLARERFDVVANNHYDADGVLSVWCALTGDAAHAHHDLLVAAAEAGDFSAYSTEAGVKVSLVLQGSAGVACEAGGDDARAYALALPRIDALLRSPDAFEPHWRAGLTAIERAMESFARGRSTVDEDPARRLSVVALAADLAPGAAHPTTSDAVSTAVAHHAHGEWIAVGAPDADGWRWRVERAFHAWADTVVRPRYARRAAARAVAALGAIERAPVGRWRPGRGMLGPALVFSDERGAPAVSSLSPADLGAALRAVTREQDARAIERASGA